MKISVTAASGQLGVFETPSDYQTAAGRPHISWAEYFSKLKQPP